MSLFKKAIKAESKLRMSIAGPSGSGKTYTGLSIATALSPDKPIALVDTEHGSASKYADLFAFDVAEMHPPFHPDKFIQAIAEAANAGYGVVILDSISHAWSGTGGVLDIVDEAAKRSRSGNTYMAWKEGTPIQNRLIDAIVQSGIHIIATMRSKTEYILTDNGNGRQAPKKVGMAPVQRDQFEYEFDVVMEMDIDNNGIITKTRCPALTGRVFAKPGENVANILREWLQGETVAPQATKPAQHRNGAQAKAPAPEKEDAPDPVGIVPGLEEGEYVHEQPPIEDNPFDKPVGQPTTTTGKAAGVLQITDVQSRILHSLGHGLYNGVWDAKRHELVKSITKGRTDSSSDLTGKEAAKLISGMEGKMRELYEADAQPLLTAGKLDLLADVDDMTGVELAQAYAKLLKDVAELDNAEYENVYDSDAEAVAA